MFVRLKWAFAQAFHATFRCTFVLIIAAGIFGMMGGDGIKMALFLLLVTLLPICTHAQWYCDTFEVTQVICRERGISVEIGHVSMFSDYQLTAVGDTRYIRYAKPVEFGTDPIYALLFENGLMAVVREQDDLNSVDDILYEHWAYYSLVSNEGWSEPVMYWQYEPTPLCSFISETEAWTGAK